MLTTVAGLALQFGPSVLKSIGSLFGGKTAETANKVAKAVEQVSHLHPAQQPAQLEQTLAQLPPEDLVALEGIKVELEREQTRRLELQLADQQAEHKETQATIRHGDSAEDEYVRRTRPLGCRLGLYAAILYVMGFEALAAIGAGEGANWELAALLMSPFLTYMGWRTADKRSHAKYGASLTSTLQQGLGRILGK